MKSSSLFLRASVLVLSLGLAACDSVEERVEKHYQRGLQLLERDETRRAQLEFRNAVKLDEDHAPSRFEIAKLYEENQQYRAAIGNYRRVAELDPTHLESRIRLSRLLGAGGLVEEARAYADAAVALAPDNPEALSALAAIALRQGDVEQALTAARRALEVAPDHAEAAIVLATERLGADDTAGALAIIDAQLARAPAAQNLNLVKMVVLERAGAADAMEAHLRRMAELYPDNLDVRRALARLFASAGKHAEAEAELRAIAAATPDDPEAALAVVRYRGAVGGEDAARAELEALIAARGDPAARLPFVVALAQLDASQDDLAAAKARLEALIAEDPEGEAGRSARLKLARLAISRDDRDTARRLVNEALALDESDVEGLILRGALLADDSRGEEAVAVLRRAVDLEPENVEALLTLATAHERAGSPDLAGERYASAMRVSNYGAQATLRYAAHLRARGQIEGAEAVLVEAARRNPTSREVFAALAELRLGRGDWAGAEEAAAQLSALGAAGAAKRIEATSLARQGRAAESVAALEELSETGSGAAALGALVGAYLSMGEIARAEALVAEALERDPTDPSAVLLAAEFDILRSDLAAAEARIRGLVSARPGERIGYAALARFMQMTGRADAAVAALEEGVAAGLADDRPLRVQLAGLYEQRGDFDRAIAQYETLHRRDPGTLVIANNLASLLAEHRPTDPEALAFAARVAQRLRGSDVPYFQDTFGWIQFLTGDSDAALRSLIPAAEALPNVALVQYHIGRVYADIGRPDEARRHLEAALAAEPDFFKADSAREALAALPSQ